MSQKRRRGQCKRCPKTFALRLGPSSMVLWDHLDETGRICKGSGSPPAKQEREG